MQNGALYQLPMLVQTISVKEFGSEPNNETFFHTPNTMGLDGGSNSRKALKKRMWLTPRVVEVDESPENFRRRMNGKRQNDRKNGFGSLTMQVKWPTPTANEDAAGMPGSKMQKMLGNHPIVRQDPNGGTLNPNWVEWLMGWPPGFTDLKPLEMDKFHCAPQQHGSYLNE
jgi:DNA (cytosine-5)-methyltransferase 1